MSDRRAVDALRRFFTDRRGAADAVDPTTIVAPAVLAPPAAFDMAGAQGAPIDRRTREFVSSADLIEETLALKILHGWLQNRHQTLLPLTLNFRTLTESQVRILASLLATTLLSASSAEAWSPANARDWLVASGASDVALVAFDHALENPEPMYRLLDLVRGDHVLEPLAYIVVVVATDGRDPADQLFAQWAATKLKLPNTVIRSVERRYRR